MKLIELARKVERLSIDNSPTILTSVGVVGTIATAIFTGKAVLKADEIISDEVDARIAKRIPVKILPQERFRLTWKCYIPPFTVGSVTIGSIIMANRIGSKRAAALAAAYTISEQTAREYREKIVQRLGTNKEQAIRDEIAQDRVNAHPVGSQQVIITGNGDVLCFDAYSGRYFNSNMENLKRAQNDTNYQVLSQGYASLSDFYERVGLPATSASEEVGWTTDKTLELEFTTTMSEDNRPCISFDFFVAPVRNYFRNV